MTFGIERCSSDINKQLLRRQAMRTQALQKFSFRHRRSIAVSLFLFLFACMDGLPRGAAAQDASAFIANIGTQATQVLGHSAPPVQRAARFQNVVAGKAFSAGDACLPPRHYHYELDRAMMLADEAVIMRANVPDSGWAVAKFSANYTNLDTSHQVYSWHNHILVGGAVFQSEAGEDICPGKTITRSNIGYGRLAHHDQVVVRGGDLYASAHGGEPQVRLHQAALDVWVEDARCPHRQIFVSSYLPNTGNAPTWHWPRYPATILWLAVPVLTGANLTVFSAATGSTAMDPPNPNVFITSDPRTWDSCRQNNPALAKAESRLMVNGIIKDRLTVALPPSQGRTHLVLNNSSQIIVEPGVTSISLDLTASAAAEVYTGQDRDIKLCCGDAVLVGIIDAGPARTEP